MAELNINLDDVEAAAPASDVVPPGLYKAEVVKSDYDETSKGGWMLTLEWLIIEGTYKSRRVWDRQNLVNKNPDAEKYARQALKAMGAAIGLASVPDSNLLHNKPMMIKVAVQPGKDNYPASNTVKGYSAVTGSRTSTGTASYTGGGQTAAASTQADATPAQGARRPWQKAG